MLELVQKSSRAQTRWGARLDDLACKLEGGFEELRQAARASAARTGVPPLPWEELWDAMDALDDAARLAGLGSLPGLEDGLRRTLARLDRFLAHVDMTRVSPVGAPAPDGRLFRVVGTLELSELPEGAVVRVARAAIVRGDRALREGEVLINRRTT